MEDPKQESKKEDMNEWLDQEEKNIQTPTGEYEKLPYPIFEDGKMTSIEIDATKPFEKWTDQKEDKTKAIVPCFSEVEGKLAKCNWWINLKNPIYKDVLHACRAAEDKSRVKIKILQQGTKQNTRYTLVKE